jgi:auxin-responsive protein IAA
MDGIPIGRKINLAAYDSFQKLSSAAEDLFRGFLQGNNQINTIEIQFSFLQSKILVHKKLH